jgi:hypothetical protein
MPFLVMKGNSREYNMTRAADMTSGINHSAKDIFPLVLLQ